MFNLRGDQRTIGEQSRKEGGKIFGSGSRTPISITLLVKKAGHIGKDEIFYRDIGDYLDQKQKLEILANSRSFLNNQMELVKLVPNEYGDWITTRNDMFGEFVPLASEKKFDEGTESVFTINFLGFETTRDSWVYNYSENLAKENIASMISVYNDYNQIDDATKIAWSRGLKRNKEKNKILEFQNNKTTTVQYRPFQKMKLYFGEDLIEYRYSNHSFFGDMLDVKNPVILVDSVSSSKDFSCFISNIITDRGFCGGGQSFPLYYYEKQKPTKQITLDQPTEPTFDYTRKDGISNHALKTARTKYGTAVTKEDIFYYVYGFLHTPSYRTTFADDLKKSLPRIMWVDNTDDFWVFSKAGRDLAELHLKYEDVQPLDEVIVEGDNKDEKRYIVQKMKFSDKQTKDTIIYNDFIKITNIPSKAYEYVVNGRSAIEWIIDRYQVKTDKASGITNDPNMYAKENNKPRYILDLLLSVIAVSVHTVDIVNSLPILSFEK
ncbi:MAG: hypothetical protein FWF57_06070 [Defluviitaleaceae bacterium]|nr:hypothetical protein [Defluviitaleaceae bacterium]